MAKFLGNRSLFDGGAAPLIMGSLTLFTLKCVVIPLHKNYGTQMIKGLSDRSDLFEETDEIFVLQALGGFFGYVIMSFLCTFLDISLWNLNMTSWKVQHARSFFTIREWFDAYSLSTINQLLFSWAATVPAYHLQKSGIFHPNTPLASLIDQFELLPAIMHLAFCGLFIEVWFFSTHRLLHYPPLFKTIHKKHHRFHAPTAVASMYAHPIEFVVGNALGVVLGPAIINCHPYTGAFWVCFSLITTGGSHSGFPFFGALDHDAHHEFFDVNYGVGVFMDMLFGTCFEGSELEKKVLSKRAKASLKSK